MSSSWMRTLRLCCHNLPCCFGIGILLASFGENLSLISPVLRRTLSSSAAAELARPRLASSSEASNDTMEQDSVNSLAAAALSTTALALLVAAGASCDFVSLVGADGEDGSFGVFCPGNQLDLLDGDAMWVLCRTFLSLALVMGAMACVLAWATACLWLTPSRAGWLLLSVSASVAAVLCVPVFLLFEAAPCQDEEDEDGMVEPSCEFSIGAYLLAFALLFCVSVTIVTQCLDPPFGLKRRDVRLRDWLSRPRRKPSSITTTRDEQALLSSPDETNDDGSSVFSCLRKWLPSGNGKDGADDDKDYQVLVKVDRTMVDSSSEEDDEEAQKHPEEPQPQQEVTVGDTASQTLIMGESASQNLVVVRRAQSDRTELSAMAYSSSNNSLAESSGIVTGSLAESSRIVTGTQWSDPNSNDKGKTEERSTASSFTLENGDRLIYTQAFVGRAPDPVPPPALVEPVEILPGMGARTMTLESVMEEENESEASWGAEDSKLASPPPPPAHAPEEKPRDVIRVLGTVELPALADSDDDDDGAEEETKDEDEDDETERKERADFRNISEDLGSLEPSAMHLSGSESLLDQTLDRTLKGTSQKKGKSTNSIISDAMQKVLYAPVTMISKKRRPRHIKDYQLMDDNNIEKSYPMSPPLEILTFKALKESEVGLNPIEPPTKREQELFDDWIKDNRASRIAHRSGAKNEPEPNLYFSSDDEAGSAGMGYSDDSGEEKEDAVDPNNASQGSSSAGRPPRSAKRRKRRGRRPKRRDYDSSRTVSSGASTLLSMPIEEETADDLDEFEKAELDSYSTHLDPKPLVRIRSAPNLAGFARMHDESNRIFEDLKMTGINSNHTAEVFRGVDSSRSSRSGKQRTSSKSGGASDKPDPPATGPVQAKKPKEKKTPLFRQERALKAGIHRATSYVSDTSSSEDGMSLASRHSKKAQKARDARIRRLQGGLSYPFSKTPEPPEQQKSEDEETTKKIRISRRMKAQLQLSKLKSTGTASSSSTNEDSDPTPQQQTPPRSGASSLTNTPGRRTAEDSGTVSSYGSGGSFMIDMLDVQLAELYRADGELKGPDEGSL